MVKGIATLFLLLSSAILQSECLEIKYLTDPSWQNLTCNPYGSELRLHCAIEEPSIIKIALKLSLFWYWTPPGAQPVNDSCQIYPYHQCNQLVGANKYNFYYKVTKNGNITQKTQDLIINDVGLEDQGCYNCRPWFNSSLLPFEKASGLFCLQPESHYEHLESCTATNSTQQISTIECTTSDIIKTSTASYAVLSESTSPSPIPSNFQNTSAMPCSKYPSRYFIIISIGVCAGLCLLSIVQMLVIVYQCYWKYYCHKGCTNRRHIPTNVINATNSYANNSARHRLPEPSKISSQHFIGTYSFVEPNGNEECRADNNYKNIAESSEKDFHKHEQDTPIDDDEIGSDDTDSVAISILSPGAHIYQTLDKYLEQLVNNPPPLPPPSNRNRTEKKEKWEVSKDEIFDDPNYSQVEIIEENSEDATRKNLSRQESQDTYDKLQPMMTDSEYAYAYSHILKLRKQLRNLKRSDANPKPPSFCLELLHVAAMGSYEVEPPIVSSTEKDKCHSTVTRKTRMKVDGKKSGGQSTAVHQYQPLNENTLNNGSSSYADLVKQ